MRCFSCSKNMIASFFAYYKLPWTDLKRLHSQKFKVDITGWVPDEQDVGLGGGGDWGTPEGWPDGRSGNDVEPKLLPRCSLSCSLHPHPPHPPHPPPPPPHPQSHWYWYLDCWGGELGMKFWSSRLKAWLCSSPWNSGHAEIFCAGRLGMVAEGDSTHSHGAWRDNQERDSWRRISFCFYALTILSICLQRCCLTQLPLSPRRKSFSGCVWAICWGWVGSHWCLSEGLCPSAGRRRAREANSDQCFDHSSALHLLLHLLHLHLVLLRSSHLDLGLRSNSLTPVVRGPEDISLRQMRRWMNTNRL